MYKNEKNTNTASKPGYGKVLPFRSQNANYNGNNAAASYQRPIGQGMSPDATKHCPTCQCGVHSQGGLENKLYGGLGMQGNQPPVQINIMYLVTPDMLGAYGQEGNYGAGQGAKILPYGKKSNDSAYGKERDYGRKAA